MKIRDVVKLKGQDLPEAVRSAAADRTRTMLAPVGLQDRIVRPGLQDIVPGAAPNNGMTDDLSLAPDPPPTSPVTISPAHRRDLDFIKARIARLPRRTDH
jgi:hypothetical protein